MSNSARRKSSRANKTVSEDFEAGILAIKEKEKMLHGEQRQLFSAVISRIQNNNSTIKDLREEHVQLRNQLNKLIEEKKEKSNVLDLEHETKKLTHDISILKRKIDLIESKKRDAIDKQVELQRILDHYEGLTEGEYPEEAEIKNYKNQLDNAQIKNNETLRLIKIYQAIIDQYDNQKSFWNREIETQQKEINKKKRDLEELSRIARQSKFSRNAAKINYRNAEEKYNIEKEKREEKLEKKTQEMKLLTLQEQTFQPRSQVQVQPSLSTAKSMYRSKQSKQNRERKEEKLRQLNEFLSQIQEEFGTNDPESVENLIDKRKTSKESLEKQASELKKIIQITERKVELAKTELEELEFAQSKNIGGERMCKEGNAVLNELNQKLMKEERMTRNAHLHYEKLANILDSFANLLMIIKREDENVPNEPEERMHWVLQKVKLLKKLIDDNSNHDIVLETNKSVLKYYLSQRENQFSIQSIDKDKKLIKEPKRIIDPIKTRAQKEKGEEMARVLDRNQVKMQAVRQAATLKPSQKRI